MPQQRESFRTVRVSEQEDRILRLGAEARGESISELVREASLEEARRALAELAEPQRPEPAGG